MKTRIEKAKKTGRWTFQLKADLVRAVHAFELKESEAIKLLEATKEEWDRLVELFKKHGGAALRSTRIQEVRLKERTQNVGK